MGKVLLSAGANIDIEGNMGRTALMLAADNENLQVVKVR